LIKYVYNNDNTINWDETINYCQHLVHQQGEKIFKNKYNDLEESKKESNKNTDNDQNLMSKINIKNEPTININDIDYESYQKDLEWYKKEHDRLESIRIRYIDNHLNKIIEESIKFLSKKMDNIESLYEQKYVYE